MDEIITFSSAVKSQSLEVSAQEVNHLEKPSDFKEIHAKLILTDEQVNLRCIQYRRVACLYMHQCIGI